jgi:hypothetical protein
MVGVHFLAQCRFRPHPGKVKQLVPKFGRFGFNRLAGALL